MCSTGSFSSQIPAPALAFALDRTLQSSFLALFLGLARIYFLQGKAFSLSSHVINSGSGWIEETDKSGHGRCTIIPSCGRLSQEVHEFVLAWAVYWDPWQWGRMRGCMGCFGVCVHIRLCKWCILCSGSLRNYSVSFIGNLEKEVEFSTSPVRRAVSHSCECMKGLRARVSSSQLWCSLSCLPSIASVEEHLFLSWVLFGVAQSIV